MVRLDDDRAAGDVVVLVDVPLCHVDQVVVAHAAGRIGHARQAEVSAIGQEGGKQGRQVGRRAAGAQMGEAGGEPRGQRNILHDLGHANPWQHAVEASVLCSTAHNEERFLLGGAAHQRRHEHTRLGAAPVSKKRIGLNLAAIPSMGFASRSPLI